MQLVSWDNPEGIITNLDLELTEKVGHNMVLAQVADITDLTTATCTDNTPA